jgi:hypothetical protein
MFPARGWDLAETRYQRVCTRMNVCVCLVRQSVTPSAVPIGYHRTVKAHIRSHLYGGPQGWNPHGSGRRCGVGRVPSSLVRISS